MNNLTIIGNVTHTPELKTTPTGINVCTFTVAANGKTKDADGKFKTEFFRVTAWRKLGEICEKYLAKGRKVAVVGEVSARAYLSREDEPRYSLEITADNVEFLSPKGEDEPVQRMAHVDAELSEDELPF